MNAPFTLTAQAPTAASPWYSAKLEEIAANIEIKIGALPDTDRGNDRRADLQRAFDLIADADTALANAEFSA